MTERITAELENIIQAFNSLAPTSSLIQMLHSLLEGIIFYRSNRENSAVQILVKRVSIFFFIHTHRIQKKY